MTNKEKIEQDLRKKGYNGQSVLTKSTGTRIERLTVGERGVSFYESKCTKTGDVRGFRN